MERVERSETRATLGNDRDKKFKTPNGVALMIESAVSFQMRFDIESRIRQGHVKVNVKLPAFTTANWLDPADPMSHNRFILTRR